jgi:hypothetical protein
MAVSIGKRKREQNDDASKDESAMRALFQKAFEAKFKPLPPTEHQNHLDQQSEAEGISEDSEDSGEWGGLSDEDESVHIVSHHQFSSEDQVEQAQERRSFMVSRFNEQLE